MADCRSSPNRALGAGPRLNRRAVFSDASPASNVASGAASGRPGGLKAWFCGVWHGVWAGLRIMSDKASLSDIATPRQAGRISAPNQRDKAPPRIHHAPGDSRRSQPRSRPARRPRRGRSRAACDSAREPSRTRRKPRKSKPFRRRRRSRPGRGRAEGQGRAIPCSPPAPASRCSTPSCAATRPPPGRCAPAWRFRAPPPPPRSCASTPTKARCATCASPSATRSGPRRSCSSLWRDLAGRPPSLDPGRLADAAARLDLACRTRTASHPA